MLWCSEHGAYVVVQFFPWFKFFSFVFWYGNDNEFETKENKIETKDLASHKGRHPLGGSPPSQRVVTFSLVVVGSYPPLPSSRPLWLSQPSRFQPSRPAA